MENEDYQPGDEDRANFIGFVMAMPHNALVSFPKLDACMYLISHKSHTVWLLRGERNESFHSRLKAVASQMGWRVDEHPDRGDPVNN